MKIKIDENHQICLRDMFSGVKMETPEGNAIDIFMRDDMLDINIIPRGKHTDNWWRVNMRAGTIEPIRENSEGHRKEIATFCLLNKAQRKGGKAKAIVGYVMTAMGGFVAALNLATMFPNPEYAASWGKVFFATALAVFGGMVLYKYNKKVSIER